MATFSNIRWIDDLHLVRYKDNREDKMFMLAESYTVLYERDGIDETYTVPRSFATDLSSVPRVFRWVASETDGIEASIVHDARCRLEPENRRDADYLFKAMLMALIPENASGWKRTQLAARYNIMAAAVRAFGWTTSFW